MIFVPMPYYGISIGHIYNKKADRCLRSAFNTAYKKSGTAILLFRQSRLWYCLFYPNSNTEPTPYVYTITCNMLEYAHIRVHRYIP